MIGGTRQAVAVTVLILAVGVAACTGIPSPTAVPPSTPEVCEYLAFESVDQKTPLGDQPAEPAWLVLTNAQDVASAESLLPSRVDQTALAETDFNEYFILVAFWGVKAKSGYSVEVKEIVQEGREVVVRLQLEEPGLETIVEPATTLPYHIVRVKKANLLLRGELSFIFEDMEGKELGRVDYAIP